MMSRDYTHQNFRVNDFLKEEPDPNNFVIRRHFTRSLFHMSTYWNPIPNADEPTVKVHKNFMKPKSCMKEQTNPMNFKMMFCSLRKLLQK